MPVNVFHRTPPPPTALPYRVRTVGRNRGQPYHSTLGTYHDDWMLTLVLSGRGTYRCRDGVLPVGPGDVGLVPPDGDVGVLMAVPEEPYDHIYCRFAGAEAIRTAERISEAHNRRPFFQIDTFDVVAETARRMCAAGERPGRVPERCIPLDAMLAYLLAQLDCPPPSRHPPIAADSLLDYMHDHLSEAADLDRMAAAFDVSKSHLCRRARRLLGDTLVRTWMTIRIDWARTLLLDTSLTVAEIGRRVGFSDPFYFSRTFRTRVGTPPSRWRQIHSRHI